MKQWKADFRRKAARNNSRGNTIRKDRRLCMFMELFPPLQRGWSTEQGSMGPQVTPTDIKSLGEGVSQNLKINPS